MRLLGYMLSATVFAVVALISVIVYGGEWARAAAILSSALFAVSQLAAQDSHTDQRIFRVAVFSMFFGFVAFGVAFLFMLGGR